MTTIRRTLATVAAAAAVATPIIGTDAPAQAAARDGVCNPGEFCLFYNSNMQGSVSDFTGTIDNYGASQPSCYEFKGAGNGKGLCVKNNAASARNLTDKPVTIYYNSGHAGKSQTLQPGQGANLSADLKNNNASHRIGNPPTSGKFSVPFPCGETWKSQTRTNHNPLQSVDFNHYPEDEGWKVYSSAPGRVSKVANLGNTSYGRYIVIDHAGGWQTLYAHLSAQNVRVGQTVDEKTMIGRVGNTGGSQGSHLHYEQKRDGKVQKVTFRDGNPVYYGEKDLSRKSLCP